MTFCIVDRAPPRAKHVTITKGMSGHFAVIVWWNPDMGGFWEPWDTGIGRYATEAEAYGEAEFIAKEEGLPLVRWPAVPREGASS